MAHEFEDKIKCPYCNHEMLDEEYEYYDSELEEIDCRNCDKQFLVTANKKVVTYSTQKIDCKDNHEYYEEATEINQKTCDKWNEEFFCSRNNHKPHKLITRKCHNCDIENVRSEYND